MKGGKSTDNKETDMLDSYKKKKVMTGKSSVQT